MHCFPTRVVNSSRRRPCRFCKRDELSPVHSHLYHSHNRECVYWETLHFLKACGCSCLCWSGGEFTYIQPCVCGGVVLSQDWYFIFSSIFFYKKWIVCKACHFHTPHYLEVSTLSTVKMQIFAYITAPERPLKQDGQFYNNVMPVILRKLPSGWW